MAHLSAGEFQNPVRLGNVRAPHPLVGDKLYGVDEAVLQRYAEDALTARDLELRELERHALHNHSLTFTSPTTRERITVKSPLAEDLRAYLDSRD